MHSRCSGITGGHGNFTFNLVEVFSYLVTETRDWEMSQNGAHEFPST
jgi:hypothetical protein